MDVLNINIENNNRYQYIDFIKGIAIFLVVLGHCIQCYTTDLGFYKQNTIYLTIYTFHMPLFIYISGKLFHYSLEKGNYTELLKRKTHQLLSPYFVCSIIYAFIHVVLLGNDAKTLSFYWFLLSLWISITVVLLINIIAKYFYYGLNCWFYIGTAMLWFLTGIRDRDAWMFIFFISGFLSKDYLMEFERKHSILLIIMSVFMLLIFDNLTIKDIQYLSGLTCFTELGLFLDSLKFILRAYASIYLIFKIALYLEKCKNKSVSRIQRCIANFGRNSLLIYILQKIFVEEVGYTIVAENINLFNNVNVYQYTMYMAIYACIIFYFISILAQHLKGFTIIQIYVLGMRK